MGKITVGQTFGRLTVLNYYSTAVRRNGTKSERIFNCKCVCGNVVLVRSGNLRSGNTRSCGCLKIDRVIKSNRTRGRACV